MPRRGTTIHPSDIPPQSSNGNRGRPSSKFKFPSFHNPFPRMFRKQTAIHPDIPQLNIEIANMWIENPLIDPYNKKVVPLSIHPKSRYVFLYKKIMDELIKDIKVAFPQEGYILTIDDCKYIKNNLPIIHSFITISQQEYIIYDHLFIKYFIKRTRKYKFDSSYCEDSEIKLYLNIYNGIKTKNPSTTLNGSSSKSQSFAKENYVLINDLLINNMDLDKTDLSIGKLVMDLCIDIKYILYMHESMITLDNYKIALRNKKTLEYVESFYYLKFANGEFYYDIYKYYATQLSNNISPPHNVDEIKYIYFEIIKNLNGNKIFQNRSIFLTFTEAYDTILILYARFFNRNIDPSKEIESSESSESSKSSKSSSSKKEVIGLRLISYCPKDEKDPLNFENISDFDKKRRKYVVNTLSYDMKNQRVHYHCFDTIEIYNYILRCIQNIQGFKNLHTTIKFTDDELDEICNKIKKFTDEPTYNSHVDIKEAINKRLPFQVIEIDKLIKSKLSEVIELNTRVSEAVEMNTRVLELGLIEVRKKEDRIKLENKLKHLKNKLYQLYVELHQLQEEEKRLRNLQENYEYNNYLEFSLNSVVNYKEGSEEYKGNIIIGTNYVGININLGGLVLPIINHIPDGKVFSNDSPYLLNTDVSLIIKLPIFKEEFRNNKILIELNKLKYTLDKLGQYDKKFPCRDSNKEGERWKNIINLDPFNFYIGDNSDIVNTRVMDYIDKLRHYKIFKNAGYDKIYLKAGIL